MGKIELGFGVEIEVNEGVEETMRSFEKEGSRTGERRAYPENRENVTPPRGFNFKPKALGFRLLYSLP